MEQTIRIQFTPVKDDYIRVTSAFQIADKRLWPVLVFMVLLELCFLSALLGGRMGDNLWNWVFILPAPLVVLYVLVVAPLNIGRQAGRNERLTCELTCQFDDSQILIKNKFAESKIDWGYYQRFFETKDFFFLVYTINKQLFQFIPKRAFESKEQENAFREMLKRNITGLKTGQPSG